MNESLIPTMSRRGFLRMLGITTTIVLPFGDLWIPEIEVQTFQWEFLPPQIIDLRISQPGFLMTK